MAQPNCLKAARAAVRRGYEVSLETSGALDVSGVDGRVSKVVDLKTPGSGEVGRNLYANLDHHDAQRSGQVRHLLPRGLYDWAVSKLIEYRWSNGRARCCSLPAMARWRRVSWRSGSWRTTCRSRFQLQLNKILWNDEPGH